VVRRRVDGRRVALAAVDFGRAVVDLGLVAVLGLAADLALVVVDFALVVDDLVVVGLEVVLGLVELVRGLAAAGFLAVPDVLAEVLTVLRAAVDRRAGLAGAFIMMVSGLAVDMVLAAMVSALAAAVIAFVAVFMAVMAEDIVLADEVALVAAAFIFVAADVTLVAADDTVLAAVAVVIADLPAGRRVLLDEVLLDEVLRGLAVVLRDRDVLRDLAVVLREDLAAVLRAVDAAVRALTPVARVLDLVFGRLAVPPDALRLTDLLRAAVAVLRRTAARFVV
jgi:hypothetical protein